MRIRARGRARRGTDVRHEDTKAERRREEEGTEPRTTDGEVKAGVESIIAKEVHRVNRRHAVGVATWFSRHRQAEKGG